MLSRGMGMNMLKHELYILPLYLCCITSVSMMFGSAIKNMLYNPDVGVKKRKPGVLPNEDHRTGVHKLWTSVDRSTLVCQAPIYTD